MATKLYVGNLSYDTGEEDLKELFGGLGTVSSCNLILDKFTGRSRGFAFVEMDSGDEAQQAINDLHDSDFQGRKIIVNEARPREERSGGGGGFGGGGGRGGRGGGGGRGRDSRGGGNW